MLIFCFLATEGPAGRPLPWARLSIESKPRAPSRRHPPRLPAWTLRRRKISPHLPSSSTNMRINKEKKEKKKKNHVYVNFIVDHFSVRKIADTFADQSCTVRGVTDVSTTKQNDSIESISYRSINVHVTKFPDSIRTFTVYILYLFVSHVSR